MNFDPSQFDPKTLMEMSQLVQQLPPDQLNRMQTIMHNMMAGFDVRKEMEEFEKTLPPGFREKLAVLMSRQFAGGVAGGAATAPASSAVEAPQSSEELPGNINEARLTLLRAVAERRITPEEALQLLFPSHA